MRKNKNTTKSTQTLLNVREKWANERKFNPKLEEYRHEDLDKKLQLFYAEVRTKDEFFYIFVENIINKKSYDRSCISWYMVTRDVFKVLKLRSPSARKILRTLKTSLVHIYHVMHSRSYDFLYKSNELLLFDKKRKPYYQEKIESTNANHKPQMRWPLAKLNKKSLHR